MKKNIAFRCLLLLMILYGCGGIGVIKNKDIDKPRFQEEITFKKLPFRIQKEYLTYAPASSLDSYELVYLLEDDEKTDTIDLLWVNREFWTSGLGGMPSRNHKGHILKSGFHFEYANKKFYLRDNKDGLPLMILNDTLYIYDSSKNGLEFPYEIDNYSGERNLNNLRVNFISLKKWL